MIPQLYRSSNQSHIALNSAQLDEIVAAILAGKYSWACFLLLRCAGYNPLDYIPYRTYNRLIKENCQIGKTKKAEDPSAIDKIGDLEYLEVVRDSKPTVQGGHQVQESREECLAMVSHNSYSPQKPKFYVTLKTHFFRFWGT